MSLEIQNLIAEIEGSLLLIRGVFEVEEMQKRLEELNENC